MGIERDGEERETGRERAEGRDRARITVNSTCEGTPSNGYKVG